MKTFQKWILPLFAAGLAVGMTGAPGYAQTTPLQKNIEDHLADLHQAKAGLDAAQVDLAAAQKALSATQDFNERQALFARTNRDQADIQTYTSEVLGDIDFLQFQWSYLTQEQRDYVTTVRQSFT